MAKTTKTPIDLPEVELAPAPVPDINAALITAFMEFMKQNASSQAAIVSQMEKNAPKVDAITTEYLADPRNREQKLLKPAFQNSYPINPVGMSDETIKKLADLKPGRYINNMVRVSVTDSDEVHIDYKCKRREDRDLLQMEIRSMSDMIDKIHAEQSAKQA